MKYNSLNAIWKCVTLLLLFCLNCCSSEEESTTGTVISPDIDVVTVAENSLSAAETAVDSSNAEPSLDTSDSNDNITAVPLSPKHEVCRQRTFYDLVYRNICPVGSSGNGDDDGFGEADGAAIARRVVCSQRSLSEETADGNLNHTVRIFNSSELLAQLGTRTNSSIVGRCTVVLFYAPWCVFCARLAPHYNALARAFPTLDVVAIDAFHFSSLNSRFGTIAVPNIMVFHNAKAVARFNSTDRTLQNIAAFVTNITGIASDPLVNVTPDDEVGPLSSSVSNENDYLLILSWMFVLACTAVACTRSATGRRVWNTLVAIGNHGEGRHHLHLD